jgi:hypothetical protein
LYGINGLKQFADFIATISQFFAIRRATTYQATAASTMSFLGGFCGTISIGNASNCPKNATLGLSLADAHGTPMFEVVLELYVMSVLCVSGLFGNVICVVVLRRDKQRRETTFLLQALAIADGLYIICAILRYPLKHVVRDRADWVMLQPYVFPLLKTCQTLCIWMMVLVTVDRFLFVCHPLRSPLKHRGAGVIVVTIVAVLYNLPRFFDSCVMRFHDVCGNRTTSRMVYSQLFQNILYFDIYQYSMYMLFLYILPLTALLVLNIKLIQAVRVSRKRVQSANSTVSYENNVTLILAIIIVVFIVCETPELFLKIATVVSRHLGSTEIFNLDLLRFGIVNEVLLVINSSSNFVIYILLGKRFRRVMKETFRGLTHSGNASVYSPDALNQQVIPLQPDRHSVRHSNLCNSQL